MECSTGWHAAIVCHLMASGRVGSGARPVEIAVDAQEMVDALSARGFEVTVVMDPTGDDGALTPPPPRPDEPG